MTARILVVDDEPDLELLIVQRFRRQIREGQLSFAFASDGVHALAMLVDATDIDKASRATRLTERTPWRAVSPPTFRISSRNTGP